MLSLKAWENWSPRVQRQGEGRQQRLWVTLTLMLCSSALPSVSVQVGVIHCAPAPGHITLPAENWGAWLLLVRNQLVF